MSEPFDLVVIGSGTAAQSVASRCRQAGWTVAMVDKRPFGGTCALRGWSGTSDAPIARASDLSRPATSGRSVLTLPHTAPSIVGCGAFRTELQK